MKKDNQTLKKIRESNCKRIGIRKLKDVGIVLPFCNVLDTGKTNINDNYIYYKTFFRRLCQLNVTFK
ncbi:MAG: hypothetical protein BGP13_12390 [Sphingobacteriales bacterium 40-81]|nr:MAG: hypothetical protein BGP13_12390 [Sphingobacteriales bacterium 40-81]